MDELRNAMKELAYKCKEAGVNYVIAIESEKTGITDFYGCRMSSRLYELVLKLKELVK